MTDVTDNDPPEAQPQVTQDQPFSPRAVQDAYDRVARDYTAAFADELDRLPLDTAMLDAILARISPDEMVLDLGCGPAPVASYLAARGVHLVGLDLSAGMLGFARRRNPGVVLVQADMRHPPFRDGSLGAVVAYYSIQHLARSELMGTLEEIVRVLAPNAVLLVAFHLGEGELYVEEFLGHPIEPLGGCLYRAEDLIAQLELAGFDVEIERRRGPLAHEADTQRIYLLARRR